MSDDQIVSIDPPTQTSEEKFTEFERELENLLNRFSLENGSNTQDFILAGHLRGCLENFNNTVMKREKWYGRGPQFTTAPETGESPADPPSAS